VQTKKHVFKGLARLLHHKDSSHSPPYHFGFAFTTSNNPLHIRLCAPTFPHYVFSQTDK